ncbi:hypothetical protein HS088_TW21G01684 [Tripterygium wilfordii]|uniref:Uncharacterized protein n=1 Tax=Tripterygium wilfordii TaxID=458696 RepID=A0A7J7C6N3_TRIWF|nr:hypothetical protein HS088_TW21G01684 [Tripterygium wilfordii]
MEEDTLSLSELPLTNSSSSWKEYFTREDQSSSPFDDDDGLFEFFSGDIAAAASSYPAEKIIFCGKDIAETKEEKKDREAHSDEEFKATRTATKSSLAFNKVGAASVTSSRHQHVRNQRILPPQDDYGYVTNKQAEKYDLSILATTPEKPRWYFFVLGIGRHTMETEMETERRAIRTTKSRKGPATKFQNVEKREVKKGKGRKSGKGSWGLLRMLGCTDKSRDRVVKATLVCMPEV